MNETWWTDTFAFDIDPLKANVQEQAQPTLILLQCLSVMVKDHLHRGRNQNRYIAAFPDNLTPFVEEYDITMIALSKTTTTADG